MPLGARLARTMRLATAPRPADLARRQRLLDPELRSGPESLHFGEKMSEKIEEEETKSKSKQ